MNFSFAMRMLKNCIVLNTVPVANSTKSITNKRKNGIQTNNYEQRQSNSRKNTPPQWQPNSNRNGVTQCQLCNWIGHTANVYHSKSHNHFESKANYAVCFTTATDPWIVDSGDTHHITTESYNLKPYHGNDGVSMGDCNEIPISHTSSTKLNASNNIFKLTHTLCASSIKFKLLFVSKFF